MQSAKHISENLSYFLQIVVGLTTDQIQELATSAKLPAVEEACKVITSVMEKEVAYSW
jgi:hypothetical protein